MTKAELIKAIHKANKDLSEKKIEQLTGAVFSSLRSSIKREGRVSYPGFGVFTVRNRKGRKVRNPATREIMTLKPTKTVGFRPAPALKRSLQ
jgi:DNA-binding protein HU-beta